ncbi:VC0807 family protein [Actinokineospora pegani]|uniref:VC0807 family protein n=1 Tax=Actinokineospora pegani TaxID=2654637 RepID=UPI0012EAF5AC|nr:VC0807 family protein [Actinokineospora pegani]
MTSRIAHDEPDNTRVDEPSTGARIAAIGAMLFFDIIAPLGLFYGLRAAGVSIWVALLAGSVPPAAHYAWQFARNRRVDGLGLFMISAILLGTLASFLTGDPRLLLAKDAWITLIAGVWICGTLFAARPFLYRLMVPIMPNKHVVRLEELWRDSPKARRVLRTMTWVWGLGFLLDSVARVVVAYTLDLDAVPVVNTVLIVVLIFALQAYSQLHGKFSGFFAALKKGEPMGDEVRSA